jgi:hypothetical protein
MKSTYAAPQSLENALNNSRAGMRTIARSASLALILCTFGLAPALAETCTTQSALAPADRTTLADSARSLASLVQANNASALRAIAVPALAGDFASFQYLLGNTAPKLTGEVLTVDQIYLLDASTLKPNADGSAPDAQFFCSLNRSTTETQFSIPALPPGRYAFAIVTSPALTGSASPGAASHSAWRLSFLLRQDSATSKWMLGGFYPKATTAAGHDGLWYWTHARQFVTAKQPWNAWLYYQAAAELLQPAPFVTSTHFDKLRTEATDAAPPSLSEGISLDAPLVLKAIDGTEYHFTALGIDDSLAQSSLDISAHLHVDSAADPAAARKRNNDAAAALVAAYPELRTPFHGVWIFAEAPNQNPFATEQPMSDIK